MKRYFKIKGCRTVIALDLNEDEYSSPEIIKTKLGIEVKEITKENFIRFLNKYA